jgi:hypothetical protein
MKKQVQPKLEASLRLGKETLRRLDSPLRAVAGGGRLRVPGGFAADTTPIDDDTTDY